MSSSRIWTICARKVSSRCRRCSESCHHRSFFGRRRRKLPSCRSTRTGLKDASGKTIKFTNQGLMKESPFSNSLYLFSRNIFGTQLRESTIEGGSRLFRGAVDAPSNIGRLAVLLASWPTKGRERAQSYDTKKIRRGSSSFPMNPTNPPLCSNNPT